MEKMWHGHFPICEIQKDGTLVVFLTLEKYEKGEFISIKEYLQP